MSLLKADLCPKAAIIHLDCVLCIGEHLVCALHLWILSLKKVFFKLKRFAQKRVTSQTRARL